MQTKPVKTKLFHTQGNPFPSLLLCAFLIISVSPAQPIKITDTSLLLNLTYLASYQEAVSVVEGLKTQNISSKEDDETIRSIPGGSALFSKCAQGVVLIISHDLSKIGAGSIIDKTGFILTSWHLVKNVRHFLVWAYNSDIGQVSDLSPAQHIKAEVVSKDEERDLALLKMESVQDGMRLLTLGNERTINITQDVFTIGHPEQYLWSFSKGVISQIRSNYTWSIDKYNFSSDIIQTQTPVSPGNSGGPVFNYAGNLIGIHSHRSIKSGVNFAISVKEIRAFLNELPELDQMQFTSALWPSRSIPPYLKYFDNNGDGVPDMLGLDTNHDNTLDVYIYDSNNDNFYDYYIFDENHDGIYDKVGIDNNMDGIPNQFSLYITPK